LIGQWFGKNHNLVPSKEIPVYKSAHPGNQEATPLGGKSMLIVRNCFVAKPGHGSKLAAQIKEAAAAARIPRHRVLTDLTGEFNRVILEFEVENVGEFEARLKDYATNEEFRAKMKGYTDLWVTGSREILQVA
jgi:hypothetical protein